MKVTISYEFDTITESEDLIAWLNTTLAGGEPVKKKKSRKPRKPMTDEEKAAFRARMVKGQEAAKARKNGNDIEIEEEEDKVAKAEALGEELAKGSKSMTAKKSVSKRKPATKKKAVAEPEVA